MGRAPGLLPHAAQEVFEAAEFVERVRRRVRRSLMLDLAAGHGLVGVLMAAAEKAKVNARLGRGL